VPFSRLVELLPEHDLAFLKNVLRVRAIEYEAVDVGGKAPVVRREEPEVGFGLLGFGGIGHLGR